jgi:hypothetical protein
MNNAPRKKSPRAPSMPLSEAIDGAVKIYSKDRRHAIPVELAAQHLGYKNANNGAAVKALASIRYFGLLGRPQEGQLAVEKELEDYHFSPDSRQKTELLRKWLLTPPVFAEVLVKFTDGLPSDAALKFELIQRGFLPDAAEAVVAVLKSSVEFAHYYDAPIPTKGEQPQSDLADVGEVAQSAIVSGGDRPLLSDVSAAASLSSVDRIPVRLSQGRRAYLEIPSPFFDADKQRLKSQIDLLITDDDEKI